MPDEFTLKVDDYDFSALLAPLAVGASSDNYPKSIFPMPISAPAANGDPYTALKNSIKEKVVDTTPADVFCRFALERLDVKVHLEHPDYELPAGVLRLYGAEIFQSWGESHAATTATEIQIKALLGVIALASRCRERPGPNRDDYLKALWARGISLVDPVLVNELNISEYNPDTVKSMVTTLTSATLALLYFSTRGKEPVGYPDSFQFGVLAIQGISNSLLSHWLRVGQLFDIGPSIVAATVPFREIVQLCRKILEKAKDLSDSGPQFTLFLQALGKNFTGFSIRASPFTAALMTLILLFGTDSRTLLYLYAGAGTEVVVEMARRAYLWTTGLRAVQGQFSAVTIQNETIQPIIVPALQMTDNEPLQHRMVANTKSDLVRYLLWLMTHYNDLLRTGVRLPDGRVVDEQTFLLNMRELLQLDPNAREFPENSLGRVLSRRYLPGRAPDHGAPRQDPRPPPLRVPQPAEVSAGKDPAADEVRQPRDVSQANLLF